MLTVICVTSGVCSNVRNHIRIYFNYYFVFGSPFYGVSRKRFEGFREWSMGALRMDRRVRVNRSVCNSLDFVFCEFRNFIDYKS